MLRLDDLLIDNYKIYQDDNLYNFTSDSVLLSKFTRVKANDVVADFCSGSGIVGLHLYCLNKEKIKSVTMFELQKSLFDLSLKSVEYNGLGGIFNGVNCKVQDMDKSYYGKFSLIVCNPPYMKNGTGEKTERQEIALCKREVALPLEELLRAISLALKFGGRVNMVYRADRLTDVVYQMRINGIEPKRLQFVSGNGKEPYLVMIEGVKGGKSGIKILENIRN